MSKLRCVSAEDRQSGKKAEQDTCWFGSGRTDGVTSQAAWAGTYRAKGKLGCGAARAMIFVI
jgi:hypothetical protein